MTYLIDANVLSEPTKPAPNSRVVHWLRANERNIVIDPIILGELSIGVLSLPRGAKRKHLEQWFAMVAQAIDCIPWDAETSRRWARLIVELKQRGDAVPLLDGMSAATALQHDFVVVTRNTRDFRKTGVRALDPFA